MQATLKAESSCSLTGEQLPILARCRVLLADGTFDSVPLVAKQLFTIHGLYEDIAPPLLYGFLPDKKESTYRRVLKVLRQHCPTLEPESFSLTLSRRQSTQWDANFLQRNTGTGLFHLRQCVIRHVNNGLKIK